MHHGLGSIRMGHLEVGFELRGEVLFKNLIADHLRELRAQIFADVCEVDQPTRRFQCATMLLVIKLKPLASHRS